MNSEQKMAVENAWYPLEKKINQTGCMLLNNVLMRQAQCLYGMFSTIEYVYHHILDGYGMIPINEFIESCHHMHSLLNESPSTIIRSLTNFSNMEWFANMAIHPEDISCN